MRLAPDDPRHGTVNGYNNLGCRCERCRAAIATAQRERNHRLGLHRPRELYLADVIQHGKSRYRKGCRCDVCRAASAAEKRRQRARHPELRARENAARVARHRAVRSRAA